MLQMVQETAIEMDGKAWQNAKNALKLAKRQRQMLRFDDFSQTVERELDSLANLLSYVWTNEQIEAIRLLFQSHSQAEIAIKLGISEAAVSKRLTNAGSLHYLRGH